MNIGTTDLVLFRSKNETASIMFKAEQDDICSTDKCKIVSWNMDSNLSWINSVEYVCKQRLLVASYKKIGLTFLKERKSARLTNRATLLDLYNTQKVLFSSSTV